MLDRPVTVLQLVEKSGYSQSKVRRWIALLGEKVSVGYTSPRTYWIKEQEDARHNAEHFSEMQTVAARNRMG
jgi:hypothetical protein